MIKSALVAGIVLVALATPALGGDWSAEKVYGPHLDKLESGLDAARKYAAGSFAVAKNPGVEVVELPASLVRTELPAVLSPVLATYEKALEAIRDAAEKDPTVASALRARGLRADDVIALGKTEDGTLRIVVESV
jgi:hypothetical protein